MANTKRAPLTEDQLKLKTARTQRWTATFGALGAIMTLVAAGLGIYATIQTQQKEEAQTVASTAQDQSAAATDQVAAISSASASVADERDKLQSENSRLTTENSSLAEQIKDLGGTTAVSTDPPGQVPEIRHKGPITVTPKTGYADLDSPSNDLQWGRNGGGTKDLGTAAVNQTFFSKTSLIKGNATYTTCQAATLESGLRYELASMKPGWTICVYTSDGRTSTMKITEIKSQSISYFVTTWELPG
ncbi:hypothetical protein [Kineosporia sp. R_H_3]|uniref:hypothetical protein n=1 Tax=Kineosporia sp. R_H_3 TaxID=1961848 RepID=UPI00117A9B87|nr:hypothetical protein [Kineosporia sp. R_H_3]